MTNNDNNQNGGNIGISVLIFTVIIAYIVAGLSAFIMSIVCFGYSGPPSYNILGIFLAMFLGPLYWLYYGLNSNYCNKNIPLGPVGLGAYN